MEKRKGPETQYDLTYEVIAERKKTLEQFFEKDKWYVKVWDNLERRQGDIDEAIYHDFIGPFENFGAAEDWSVSVGFIYEDAEGQLGLRKGQRHLMTAPHTGEQFIHNAESSLRWWKPTKIVNPDNLSESKYLS